MSFLGFSCDVTPYQYAVMLQQYKKSRQECAKAFLLAEKTGDFAAYYKHRIELQTQRREIKDAKVILGEKIISTNFL